MAKFLVIVAAAIAFLGAVPSVRGRPRSGRINNVDNDVADCDRLAHALYRTYREVMLPVYDRNQVLDEIKTATGIDPENQQALKQFACSIQGSTSVKEMSQHFLLPYRLVWQLYSDLMGELSACGGVQGCKVYMRMMNELAAWVRNVHYPDWPLRSTQAQTAKFLRHMAADYGSDFLMSRGLFLGDYPPRPLVINEENVDSIAKSLVEATSLSDLARLTGLPEEVLAGLDAGLKMLATAGNYVAMSNGALQELLEVTDELGLLYLPEKRHR